MLTIIHFLIIIFIVLIIYQIFLAYFSDSIIEGLENYKEYDNEEDLEKSENLYKLNRSPYRHLGSSSESLSMKKPRNPFKNFR